jgi:NADPH:quinone reductase-like Zn-dependent oxidoreductase
MNIITSLKMMKAVRMRDYGEPDVLKFEDARRMEPGAGEILVRVRAAGVNPLDWKVREGRLRGLRTYSLPLIPGWDFSGVVEALGPGAARFQPGDEVYGCPDPSRDGAYAEFLVMKESEAAFKPRFLDDMHAAAVPLAGLTAWQALFDVGGLAAGQTVMIHGAAGGVGGFALQLAKWKGARVIGTASERNQGYLRLLGADETIDYQFSRFDDMVLNADMVLDTIGSETERRSWRVLKKGGILVSTVGEPSQDEAKAHGVRAAAVHVRPNAVQLTDIAELIDLGKLHVVLEAILPLSQARRAQEISKAGHTRGKVVLRIG